ncbi:o-succinylbenzoate synthase [Argonema antarcticum A004/B2]|nr:o-succinylbenzoate synthase [Argonema antarcticum]MCL1469291.1 o-succinylbenzoate synthase [Argonema antarcticum A004/B2]
MTYRHLIDRMIHYKFEFRSYQRRFRQPLQTSHGVWEIREGIIIRLTDETGHIGWGEIAPLTWFGSETIESALDFCRQLPNAIKSETIFSIPDNLPCCQFGFESAWEALDDHLKSQIPNLKSQIAYSGLLPAGKAALDRWQVLWQQGTYTFKWKIGVAPIQEEMNIFDRLIEALPTETKLRLDANAGLNWQEANKWLGVCDIANIEFLEQPLPIDRFDAMLDLSKRYSTPLALDESVATIKQLQTCYQLGWRSIFVIKPCIVGSPKLLRQFCQQHDIDAVFSSVFETTIGRQAALNLAAELSRHNRAVGFGVNHWFNEDDERNPVS